MSIRRHINTYIGGMDKDTSQQKFANSKYYDAQNLRPITDKGLSTGALENIKGTEILAAFPQVRQSLVIEAKQDIELDSTQTYTHHLYILSSTLTPLINVYITYSSFDDLFNQIITYLNNIPTGPSNSFDAIKLDDQNRIVVYFNSPIAAYNSNQPDPYVDWEIRQPLDNFIIVGSVNLRDKTILFTVNQTGGTGFGQIWSLTYDIRNITTTGNIELLYNEKLDLSLDHPVKTVSRYETRNLQRVYWTDNYNKPRSVNIARKDLLAVRVSDLLLVPEVNLQPAYVGLEESITGNLPAGLIYTTYKLQKVNGNITPLAPFNNPTPVCVDIAGLGGGDTAYEEMNYTSGLLITNKSLNFTVPVIPRGFDKIIVYAIVEDLPGNYTAYQVKSEYLDNDTSYTFQLNSFDNAIQVTIADVLLYDIDFETVKTLKIKDNTLLYGNVSTKAFDIDFDARAYRFDNASQTTYTTVDLTQTDNWGVAKNEDLLNPMNKDSTALATLNQGKDYRYKYNSNPSSTPFVLGGSGPNVEYEFTTTEIILDDSRNAAPSNLTNYNDEGSTAIAPFYTPFVNQPAKDTIPLNVNGLNIEAGPGFQNFKNNRFETYLKGYMPDEIYRLGVVFFSKSGKPSTVKWIDDIRFPCAGDLLSGNSGAETPFLSKMTRYVNGVLTDIDQSIGQTLGLKISIDVTSIKDQISGGLIVRAQRKPKDKTILAQGSLGEIREQGGLGTSGFTRWYNYTDVVDSDYTLTVPSNKVWNFCTFDAPDLKFQTGTDITEYDGGISSPYYFKPVGGYFNADTGVLLTNGFTRMRDTYWDYAGGIPYSGYTKSTRGRHHNTFKERLVFSDTSTSMPQGEIKSIKKVSHNESLQFSYIKFGNQGYLSKAASPGSVVLASPAVRTVLVEASNSEMVAHLTNAAFFTQAYINNTGWNDPYGNTGLNDGGNLQIQYTASGSKSVVVDLYRELADQYGGSKYKDIIKTEYISTGCFFSVDSNSTTINVEVYGGDVYLNLMTERKLFSESADPTNLTLYRAPQVGIIYPTHSVVNLDMRTGRHLNNFNTGSTDAEIAELEALPDDYECPPVYIKEKNLQVFHGEDSLVEEVTEFDNRIYKSEVKSNGEQLDAWSVVRPLAYIDVDGEHGPVNEIENIGDKLIFWQDNAIGTIALNPRSTVTDNTGTEIELGVGKGLVDFDYISTTTGSKHQWSIQKSNNAIYFFDANQKKIYRINGNSQLEPISTLKSISSYLYENIDGDILVNDNPIQFKGISTFFCPRFNEVGFTFHTQNTIPASPTIGLAPLTNTTTGQWNSSNYGILLEWLPFQSPFLGEYKLTALFPGNPPLQQQILTNLQSGHTLQMYVSSLNKWIDLQIINASTYTVGTPDIDLKNQQLYGYNSTSNKFTMRVDLRTVFLAPPIATTKQESFTLIFNEYINAFSGFYSHYPRHYITDYKKIMSQDPYGSDVHIHDEGVRGKFYGQQFPSTLSLIVNPQGPETKVFNNFEFLSQVEDSLGNDIFDETITSLKVSNEYQNSGKVTLLAGQNVKRRMRTWRANVPRDNDARIRNPYTQVDIEFDSGTGNDKRIILHDINTYYSDTSM